MQSVNDFVASTNALNMIMFILIVVLILIIILVWTSSSTQILSNSDTPTVYALSSSASNVVAEGGQVFQLIMAPRSKGSIVRITNLQLSTSAPVTINQPLLITYDNSVDHSGYVPNNPVTNSVSIGQGPPAVVDAPQYSAPSGLNFPYLPAGTTTSCLNTDGNSGPGSWVCSEPLSVVVHPS